MKKDAQLNVHNYDKMRLQFAQAFDWLRVDTIDDCNVHCVYCHNTRSKRLLDDKQLGSFFNENIEIVENMQFGCTMEPTLDPRLADMMQLAGASKARPTHEFRLQTNGTLLQKHDLKKMGGSGLNHLTVSIDTVDEETSRSLRGGVQAEVVLRNVAHFKKELPDVAVSFITTVTKLNFQKMKELVKAGFSSGVTRFCFREIFYFPNNKVVDHSRMPDLVLAPGEFKRMAEELQSAFGGAAKMIFNDKTSLADFEQRSKMDSLR